MLRALLALALCVPLAADAAEIAVFYPEVREPYASVFSQIIDGVRDVHADLDTIALSRDVDPASLESSVRPSWRGVVGLGSRGVRTTLALELDLPLAVGGIISPQREVSLGVSLTPAPSAMFERLRELSPRTRSVWVVYSDTQNGWLMPRVERAAQDAQLTLHAFRAKDLAEAARLYRDILGRIGPEDSIWLPHDRATVDAKTILPFLLEAAWDSRFVLFSSTGSHVRRGVLFAMYPNHRKMGQRIGTLLAEAMAGNVADGIVPSTDLRLAVNVRTASHIGLQFSGEQQDSFDLVFPTR